MTLVRRPGRGAPEMPPAAYHRPVAGQEPSHPHHDDEGRRTLGHYAADFLRNWHEHDSTLAEKVRLTIRNRVRAFAPPFRACCGHPGEPGC
jgi:hypothetical protein